MIMAIKKTILRYFKEQYSIVVGLNKKLFSKKTLTIEVLDLIGYFLILATIFTITGYLNYLLNKVLQYGMLTKEEIISSLNIMSSFSAEFDKLKITAIILAILFLLIFYLIWSLFKGLIYTRMMNKRFTMKYFIKKYLLNMMWITSWLIILVGTLLIIKLEVMPYMFWILVMLMFHLTIILYIRFTEKNKIFTSIKLAFKTGIKKIHYFILPYLLIFVAFFIVSGISYLGTYLHSIISLTITIILLLLFLAWSRYYIIETVKYYQ